MLCWDWGVFSSYQRFLFSETALEEVSGYETPLSMSNEFELNLWQYPLLRKMGIAALRSGCVHEAVMWLERCAAMDPADAEVRDLLEEAYGEMRTRWNGA